MMVVKWIQFVVGKNINSLSKCVLSNYEPSHGLHGQQRSKCPHDERRRFMYGILFRGISLVSNNRFLTIVRLPRDLRVSIARFWRVWAVVEFTKFNTCNRFPVAGAQTRKPYNFSLAMVVERISNNYPFLQKIILFIRRRLLYCPLLRFCRKTPSSGRSTIVRG